MNEKIIEFLEESVERDHQAVKGAVAAIIKAYGQVEPESIYKTYTEGDLHFSCNRRTGKLHVTCKGVTVFDDSVAGNMSVSEQGLSHHEAWLEQMHKIAESITGSA